jgi:hypothetical protein
MPTAPNPASILDSIKKVLGLAPDFTEFDLDVIMHINTTFGSLQQLGLGPITGFAIVDNTLTWTQYSSDMVLLAAVKSYIFLKVKLLFDPPGTSFNIDAVRQAAAEYEWRLNIMAETINPPTDPFTGTSGSGNTIMAAYWWDLTGDIEFPVEAVVGDLGIDMDTGDVWRNAA